MYDRFQSLIISESSGYIFHFDWTFLFQVLCRVKVTLIDTVVRVEHLPDSAEKGVALEIKIKRWIFYILQVKMYV